MKKKVMFPRVKGTNDFYPEDSAKLQYIMGTMANVANKYGFAQVTPPALETLKCLTAKSGEEIKSQIFVLEKKAEEQQGLRFDLTIPLTRMFVAKQRETAKPVKWFAVDDNWRYEAPQKGREREFYQLSVELFGSDKPVSDAEVINLFVDCYKAVGLTEKDFFVRLNNRKLLEGLLGDISKRKNIDDIIRVVDKFWKIEEKEFKIHLEKLKLDEITIEKIRHVVQFNGKPAKVLKELKQHFPLNGLASEGAKELEEIIPLLPDNVKLDLSIARGLAYYTGNVFEAFDTKGEFRSLGGGGRYDQLVELLGGTACPATGFAIGYSTTSLLLEKLKRLDKLVHGPDYFIAIVKPELTNDAFELAAELRKKYNVEVDLMHRKIGKQFDYANTIGAKKVIVLGPEEVNSKKYTVKDMKSGKESKKIIKEL